MKLTHAATVAAPVERVWAVVMDVPVAAKCVPGVTSVTAVSPDAFKGSLGVQIGPVRLALDGNITVTARDDATRTATLRADARDTRLGGTLRATVQVALRDVPGGTELAIQSDIQIGGRIGEFGQPIIQRKADQLLTQFAQCLARTATG